LVLLNAAFCVLAQSSFAQSNSPAVLDGNETLFSVVAAINSCGYDYDLNISNPVRSQIRNDIADAVKASEGAKAAQDGMCQFYNDHKDPDPARTLAKFISVALFLGPPPQFTAKAKEVDTPPDAAPLLPFAPLLQTFYEQAGLHNILKKHRQQYVDLIDRYHDSVSKILFDAGIYLKIPQAGAPGHEFSVFIEPMGAPSQVNARTYGADYYVIISPGTDNSLKLDQIRHAYLHYLLDPFSLKYPGEMQHMSPLLQAVKAAPMDQSYKDDAGLLIVECLIRAVEIRTSGSKKDPETERDSAIEASAKQGFVLTRYFYDQLVEFEKSPTGFRLAFPKMLEGINPGREAHELELAHFQFATSAAPDVMNLSAPPPPQAKLLSTAEEKLSEGDPDSAQKLAQQALADKTNDPARAYFVLARAAIMSKDIKGAQDYFLHTVEVAQEPRLLAWSHIYLGRIFDLQDDRATAVEHYRAALTASANLPEAKLAAQSGIDKPYTPHHAQ
jgi:tetratricopeptide (TPR) repeat protein